MATIVQIHGNGMAPSILDGDHVLVVRGDWTVERGDIVVYDPRPLQHPPKAPRDDGPQHPNGGSDEHTFTDVQQNPRDDLRNTAVVDMEDLESRWENVQAHSDPVERAVGPPRVLRVGRVLAVPGDTLTFHVPDAAMGLAVNGKPLEHKPSAPIRLRLGSTADAPPVLRGMAYETLADRRYPVLHPGSDRSPRWQGLSLPGSEEGPVEIEAEGYLVVADNRDEGACCDSRAIGWVIAEQVRGEVLLRLSGDPSAAPDLAPAARGFSRLP